MEAIKQIFKVGAQFDGYYGNGKLITKYETNSPVIQTVTKVTDKSCWINESRYSWNTIKEYYRAGFYVQCP